MRIIGVIGNVNMSASHDRLALIASDLGIDVALMDFRDVVIFTNKKRTRAKALTGAGKIIGYIANVKVDEQALQFIPMAFDSSFKFDEKSAGALQKSTKKEINCLNYRARNARTTTHGRLTKKEEQTWQRT